MPRHALFLWTVGGIAGSTSTSTSDATGATSLLWLRNRLSTDGTDDASSWTECKWTAIVTSYMRQPDGGVGASSVSASATAQVQPSTKKRAKLAATRQQQQVPPPFFSVMTERRSAVDEQMMMASGGGPSTHIIGSGSGVTRDMFMLYPRHQSGSDKIIKNVVDARTYAVIQTDPHLEALLPGTKFKQLQRRHVLRVEGYATRIVAHDGTHVRICYGSVRLGASHHGTLVELSVLSDDDNATTTSSSLSRDTTFFEMVRDQVLPVGARTSQIMFDGRVMGGEAPDVNVDDERTAEVGDVDTTVQLCREALALVAFVKREGVL